MSGKRENYIDFDTYYMAVALIASERSKDPSTQVGAVVVKDKYIISIGYNGTPEGMNDDEMPWDSIGETTGDLFKIKNSFVIHAEADALDNLPSNFNPENASIYVTLFPCLECAKRIVNMGIKKVVYLKEYNKEITKVTQRLFDIANVEVTKYNDYKNIRMAIKHMNNKINKLEQDDTMRSKR